MPMATISYDYFMSLGGRPEASVIADPRRVPAIHAALTKNGYLPGATARKARAMTQWFRLMNFQSDKELEQLISQLERLAASGAGKKKRSADGGQVKRVLDDIIELTYRDAQALTQPSRIGALEL